MTTLRAIGHLAGVLALAVALAGCGDDGDSGSAADSTITDDTGSAAEESADEDGAEASDGGGSDGGGDGTDSGDAGDAGEGESSDGNSDSDGDSGSDGESGSGDGESEAAAPGVYREYSADAVADTTYDTTILFFHASWCPECRAFEEAIQDEGVPDGVQILKTDYDAEQDLKEEYGITIQSSFVKVDPDGNELSKWFGYGEDKSVDTILEQLG